MYDELTAQDIKKMEEELEDRIHNQRPVLLAEVVRCREFGDLSENFEYKEAKRAKNRNESRIRYLKRMISTATVITDESDESSVGLYDRVTIYMADEDEEEVVQVVTTVRVNPLEGMISRESPMGKAILGKHEGDKVTIKVSDDFSYEAEIRKIEKCDDDGSAPLLQY